MKRLTPEALQPARPTTSPLPPVITEHPAWRQLWEKLLRPLPDETPATPAGERVADEVPA